MAVTTTLSGIYSDPAAGSLPGVTLNFTTINNSCQTQRQSQVSITTDENAFYTISLVPNVYSVCEIDQRWNRKELGLIHIFADSKPGTLNEYLVAFQPDDVQPGILQAMQETFSETQQHATTAQAATQEALAAERAAAEQAAQAAEQRAAAEQAAAGAGAAAQAETEKLAERLNSGVAGAALIGVRQPVNGSVDRTQRDVNAERISALDLGVLGDGVTDDTAAIRRALIIAAEARRAIHFPEGVYLCSNFFSIPSYSRIICAPGAVFRLTAPTSLGGVTVTGINNSLAREQCEDVETHNLTIDCNFIAGENGINGLKCRRIRHYNPRVINSLYHPTKLGGRAFQYEGDIAEDVAVFSPVIENCSFGINSQGLPGTSINVRAISYHAVFMKNVDIPFNIDSQVAVPTDNTPSTMSTSVFGAVLHNCGRITGGYGTDELNPELGGGIICGDRGYGLYIDGLRVINDAAYNGIGAIIRGQMFGVTVRGLEYYGAYAVSVINHNPVGFGMPGQAAYASQVSLDGNINVNLDYVWMAHDSGALGKSRVKIGLNIPAATLSRLFDVHAGGSTKSWIEIINTETGFSSGMRTLRNLYNAGNSIGVIDHYEETDTWVPVDGSGAALTITKTGAQRYIRQGNMVFISMNIVFPATTDTADATISGLPFVGSSLLTNSSGALCFSQKTIATLDTAVVVPGTNTVKFFSSTGAVMRNTDMSGASIKLAGWYFV